MTKPTSDVRPTARIGRTFSTSTSEVVQKYGLLIVFIVVMVVFTFLRPDTFLAQGNVRNLLTAQAVTGLLALGVMVPLATNQFDMSVGYHVGLAHVLMIGLIERYQLNWVLAAALVLVIGIVVGWVNGVLFTRFGINSFIATLGTGIVLYGFTNWFTGGEQIIGTALPAAFTNLSTAIGPVPVPAIIVAAVGIVLYVFLEHTVAGRSMFVVGSSPRAAELTGINVKKSVATAFMVSGLLAALAGIILASNLRSGTASVGSAYLLPAFAGAMLGATSIKPGRMNVVGTVFAVLTLTFLFSGVQQLGAPFFVQYFFNGGILVVAVGLSVFAAKKYRERAAATA